MYAARFLLGMAISLAASSVLGAPADERPAAERVVMTTSGPVQGITSEGSHVFKGVPFAGSSGGNHRWRPPTPAPIWSRPLRAAEFGPACPQPTPPGHTSIPQSEDCLSANIATPSLDGPPRPVLVLIHGGAFFVGSGREAFDAAARTYNKRGIVVVSFNYRLGRLGFFSHPGLRAEQPGTPTGNYWLMDQVAALHWIHANIARFGGNPDKVTIMGCSAGGSSVNALVASPMARGLFARASAHSGGGLNNATRPQQQADREGMAFAARAGVTGKGPDAIAALRKLSPAAILQADPGPPNFGAILDGSFIPEETAVAFARGDIARVPYIAGSTSNEASIFGLMGFNEATLKKRFNISLSALRPVYDPEGRLSSKELLRQIETDFLFTSAAAATAGLAARWQKSWLYYFRYLPPEARGKVAGAPHCADFPYVTGGKRLSADPETARIASLLQDYTANFVRSGDPNSNDLPGWAPYKGENRGPLVVDKKTMVIPDFRKRQLAWWWHRWAQRTGEKLP